MRKYYIDNIRWMTIVLVVVYHVIYMFNGIIVEGVIGPITEVRCQDAVQYLLYPWFMVILFIISGMCAKYYLDDHSDREFIRVRTRKLLVPSTIGLLVFGWIQGYFNMAVSNAFDTMSDTMPGIVMYLIMVASGTGVLWTIQVMWILSMVLILVRRMEKGRLGRLGEKTNMAVLIALVLPVWGAAQILNTPVICVYRFGIYGFCFLLGYYVFSHDTVISQLEKYRIPLLIAAAFAGLFYTYCYYGEDYAQSPVVNCPLAILYAWLACLAVIGCVRYWGDRTGVLAQFMKKKSFGLYVFHYLPLSASAYFLTKYTQLNGAGIYALTTIAAFGGGLLLYEIISRIPVLRWCVLGIRKESSNVSG
ncbi:MAG: acyltransferase [Coprococcus sp.]